jgi:hypothetical protein
MATTTLVTRFEFSTHLQEDPMASKDGFRRFLESATHYFKTAPRSPKAKPFGKSPRWFVTNPSAPLGDAQLYRSFKDAENARKGSEDAQQHTFGPLTAIFDISSGMGWDPNCPIHAVLATRDKTTIVAQDGNKPHLVEYEGKKFTTFIVVVPND